MVEFHYDTATMRFGVRCATVRFGWVSGYSLVKLNSFVGCSPSPYKPLWRVKAHDTDSMVLFEAKLDERLGYRLDLLQVLPGVGDDSVLHSTPACRST